VAASLTATFEQTYKLSNPVSITPATTDSDEVSGACGMIRQVLPTLNSNLRQAEQTVALSIEQALLAKFNKSPSYCDVTIEKFTSVNTRADFRFKLPKYRMYEF
jgi:hypothetical protein